MNHFHQAEGVNILIDLISILPSHQVILLSVILEEAKGTPGWLKLPTSRIRTIMKQVWTEQKINQQIKKLCESGLLAKTKRGIPAYRWIRINYKELQARLDQARLDQASAS